MIRSLIVAIALVIGVTLPARADLGTGLAAYEQSNYATAIKGSNLLAKQGDKRREETYGPPALPQRADWTERVFFAPGYVVVLGFFDLAKVLDLPSARDTVRYLISHYGDAFLGLIAVLMWLAFLGLAILAKRIFDSLRRPEPPQSYIYDPAETHRRRDRSESSVEESNAPAGAVAARPGLDQPGPGTG